MLHLVLGAGTALLVPGLTARAAQHRAAVPQMGFFDGLAAAFENDAALGERENAGIRRKKLPQAVTWVAADGTVKESQAIPGQKLKDIARKDGIGPIKYNCNEVRRNWACGDARLLAQPRRTPLFGAQGTCSSCDMLCNGDRVPACVAKMVRQCPTAMVRPATTQQPDRLWQPDWDVEVAWGLKGSKQMGLDRRSP